MKKFSIGQEVFYIQSNKVRSGRIIAGVGAVPGDPFRFRVGDLKGVIDLTDDNIYETYEYAQLEIK